MGSGVQGAVVMNVIAVVCCLLGETEPGSVGTQPGKG